MEMRRMKLRSLIYGRFVNEAEFARRLGWSRQRLNKITTGAKEPNLTEVRDIALALNVPFDDVANIFLG